MSKEQSEVHLLPLVIGVSGHIDIKATEKDRLRKQVREVLLSFRSTYPSTPLIVLSPLAEGADRIVAEVALEPAIGARLVVPLPFPREMYEEDFADKASLKEFTELLHREGVEQYTIDYAPGNTLEKVATAGIGRNIQYAWMGLHIARHAHVLLALWDEEKNLAVGGTSQVVQFRLEGVVRDLFPGIGESDLLETGPVYHLYAPRENSENATQTPAIRELYPESHEYETVEAAHRYYHEHAFLPIDQFNALAAKSVARGEKHAAFEPLVPEKGVVPASLMQLERLFHEADRQAIAFRRETHRTLLHLSLVVALAALLLDGAAHLPYTHELHWWKSVLKSSFVALMGVAFLLLHLAKKGRYQDRYQDYRALAEGLRVQFFWKLAGLKESVADFYLSTQRLELYWIRRACQTAHLLQGRECSPLDKEKATVVLNHWVKGQHEYYASRSVSARKQYHSYENGIRRSFIYGLFITSIMAALGFIDYYHVFPEHSYVAEVVETLTNSEKPAYIIIMLSVVVAAIGAGLLHNYVEKLALAEHAEQYHRMERAFRRAETKISELIAKEYFEAVEKAFLQIGGEALTENGDWVITHRHRPIEVPHH